MIAKGWLIAFTVCWLGSQIRAAETAPLATVVAFKGTVEVLRAGTATWRAAVTNQALAGGDLVRTGERSGAEVRVSGKTLKRLGELTIYQVQPGGAAKLLKGLLYFFHRDQPGTFPIETPSTYAVIIGTEFHLEVADNGATTLHLIDGRVEMTNEAGRVNLTSGQSAVAQPGQPPVRTAALETIQVIQWALYYPGVLDLNEVRLGDEEQRALAASLRAYRSGDLPGALADYRMPSAFTSRRCDWRWARWRRRKSSWTK